ncbi:hypothetical protein PCANC_03763 [Puccinia coronata f. sp. avenae]|uniref:Uncharacterized protein n=1 Tax=Puccinia coronata f. sp. avenae TaxID=200324 RepID=A0A2N5VVB6_9BASI|nr:hypothetical protein PCANC_03763 [Puccinia coronata f. sp. avenae]
MGTSPHHQPITFQPSKSVYFPQLDLYQILTFVPQGVLHRKRQTLQPQSQASATPAPTIALQAELEEAPPTPDTATNNLNIFACTPTTSRMPTISWPCKWAIAGNSSHQTIFSATVLCAPDRPQTTWVGISHLVKPSATPPGCPSNYFRPNYGNQQPSKSPAHSNPTLQPSTSKASMPPGFNSTARMVEIGDVNEGLANINFGHVEATTSTNVPIVDSATSAKNAYIMGEGNLTFRSANNQRVTIHGVLYVRLPDPL